MWTTIKPQNIYNVDEISFNTDHLGKRLVWGTKRKAQHIVSALQPEVAQEFCDILISPPADKPYSF